MTEEQDSVLRAIREMRDEMRRDMRLLNSQASVTATTLRHDDQFQNAVLAELHAMTDSYRLMLDELRGLRAAIQDSLAKLSEGR